MELTGEEKKMQMLFSELRLADEQTVPSLSATWNRAQARRFRPRRAFNFSFAAATALLICALASLAWWSTHWQRAQQPIAVAGTPSGILPTPKAPEVTPLYNGTPPSKGTKSEPTKRSSSGHRFEVRAKLRADKLSAQQEANLLAAAQKQAAAISGWQSPTSTLMNSANDDLLKSLPKLNESTNELKSFLPSTPK